MGDGNDRDNALSEYIRHGKREPTEDVAMRALA